MFPLGDDQRHGRGIPWVTLTLIAANVLVYAYRLTLDSPHLDDFVHSYGLIPGEVERGSSLHTLFTSMFIHGSFGHLVGNLLFLWIFGDNIEHRFGRPLFLLFYLGTGLVADGAHVATHAGSGTPVVGASGAISGIIGAYMLLYPLRRIRVAVWYYGIVSVPAFVFLGLWFLFQLANGLATLPQSAAQTSGVAFWSHIGGFGAGLGGAALLGRFRPEPTRARVAFAIWRDREDP